jgi:hypothetical protein
MGVTPAPRTVGAAPSDAGTVVLANRFAQYFARQVIAKSPFAVPK